MLGPVAALDEAFLGAGRATVGAQTVIREPRPVEGGMSWKP